MSRLKFISFFLIINSSFSKQLTWVTNWMLHWFWFSGWTWATTWTCLWNIASIELLALQTILKHHSIHLWIFVAISFLPSATAFNPEQKFPDISFQDFSTFILENFSSKVSLSTVLMALFSMTNNPELLSLHARHQISSHLSVSSWMNCLASAILERLDENASRLYHKKEVFSTMDEQKKITTLSTKLDEFSKLLNLYPVDKNNQFKGKLKVTSNLAIEPVYIIAPNTPVCLTESCNLHAVTRETRDQDIA